MSGNTSEVLCNAVIVAQPFAQILRRLDSLGARAMQQIYAL
jgi:hypothetical protein